MVIGWWAWTLVSSWGTSRQCLFTSSSFRRCGLMLFCEGLILLAMYKFLCLAVVRPFQTTEGFSDLGLSSRLMSPYLKRLKQFLLQVRWQFLCSLHYSFLLTLPMHSVRLFTCSVRRGSNWNFWDTHYQSRKIKNELLIFICDIWI